MSGDAVSTLCERIAREAHAKQIEESTGDPYIRHIERVVAMVSDEAKPVAWLHDVIEDCLITAVDLEVSEVPHTIISAVEILTRRESETYGFYIESIRRSSNLLALEVKIADLRDHLRPNCPAQLLPRYLAAWKTLTGKDWSSDAR